jgi:small subunit ribosomal protein S5
MIDVRRVTRVVSGGRRFSFSVALVIGDRKGHVGFGIGKSGDTSAASTKLTNKQQRK